MNTLAQRSVTGAIAAAMAVAGVAGQAAAQQSSPPVMRGLMGDMAPAGTARQYATPDGAVRFVFDRSGRSTALVLFEGDPEVHVLRPVGGVGGAEIYRTESGDVVLRLTPHGGITVYTRNFRTGAPVAEERDVAPLAPPMPTPNAYQSRLRTVEVSVTRRVGRPVTIVTPPNPAQASGVVLDAAERAAAGVSATPDISIERVAIIVGQTPAAFVRGDTLFIQIVPQLGYAGRPSTAAIRAVLAGGPGAGPER